MTVQTVERSQALRMQGISKQFRNVVALQDVSFDLNVGEVLALVGENGAGKSTLMKILSGAYRADSGTVELFGEVISHPTPELMLERGVAVIYQELLLANDLTVAENIYLGRLPRNSFGMIDWDAANQGARKAITRLGFDINPETKVRDLSVAHQQIVEIAKALSRNAQVVVLDEPSAVLGDSELRKLFEIIARLSAEGISFIYISHRLEEVFEISHRTVVLRDGRKIGVEKTSSLTKDALVKMMVGRELTNIYPERKAHTGETALVIEGLSNHALKNINVTVRKGEILGVCGLAGSGRTELLRAICGADEATAIRFEKQGMHKLPTSPKHALENGIGLLPEDRKQQGLFLGKSVAFNVSIARLAKVIRNGMVSHQAEKNMVNSYISSLRVKTSDCHQEVGNLSGGNQQKCVLAKLLNADCNVLLIDEPTRGVDIGAKREMYQAMIDLADNAGLAIIMVSSELPEIIGLSDRVLVMRSGEVTAELPRAGLTEEKIMHAATD
ncbi:sugar ABC transporter ATP-binding protein [Klebsiella variicola]|uniref:sugar ABC transporter ATP-binding protein n=1 Tax=Klebsiella variicola TaxID=244366 RepID=UPI001C243782|nr:sugar ABC transporter ATP-binding protein [Klebsiella variicola]MBU9731536.1 sugar ABC transporter ATP-binding protein [Klebsiella variicola]